MTCARYQLARGVRSRYAGCGARIRPQAFGARHVVPGLRLVLGEHQHNDTHHGKFAAARTPREAHPQDRHRGV